MMRPERKRTRPGDFFRLAVLLANLVCGVGLIGALRADLSKDLVAAESTLASSKISAYLWGKVLRFTSAVERGSRACPRSFSLYDNMKVMAVTDCLILLYNHREFYQSLRRELERARRYRHNLSLLS